MKSLNLKPAKKPDHLISYWQREWKIAAAIIFFGVTFNSCMSFGPILQGRLIDTIVSGKSLQAVIHQSLIFVGMILFIQIMRFFKRYYVRLFANRTSATMRMMIYNNIMNRGIIELRQESTGDLMTKAVSDVELCVEGMRKVTTEIFDTGVLMIGYLISMLVYDAKITILSVLFVPAAMWLAERLKKIIVKFSKTYRQQTGKVADLTYYNVDHALLYRINGIESINQTTYSTELDDLEHKAVKATVLENSMQPIYNVIAQIGILAIIYFCGIKVIAGDWTVGMFSAYFLIFAALTTKASKAAKLFNSAQKAQVSWQRIKPYLSEYKTKDTADRKEEAAASLDVRNLSFSYPGSTEVVIDHINFAVRSREIVGVTGPIASGKSTLGVALQGQYPYSGSVKFNGTELSDFSEYELSQRVSYLGHQPELLSDTIYNNITLGEGGDILPVLHHVCFDQDLAAMPEGIYTTVGSSGIRLSGGQQARIALARALYRKSRLLILDDPFSAVDMATESAILSNIHKNYTDRIIILISHRISCFPQTNHILFLNSDKSILHGTHQEIMQKSPLYASIFAMQTGEEHEA